MIKPNQIDDQTYARALIDRERADARAGLIALGIFFGLGTLGSLAIALTFVLNHNTFTVPLILILALIGFSAGRRLWRLARALRNMRSGWDAGKLVDGQDALEVARARKLRLHGEVGPDRE